MASAKKSSENDVDEAFTELRHELNVLRVEQQDLYKRARDLEKRNLRLSELNQSKDEFIAIASHQLRTPATGVKQYIGLLLEGYTEPLTPSQTLFLEKALQSNDRQLQIIDDLLQVARIDSSTFRIKAEPVDVVQLITLTVNELNDMADDRKQNLVLEVPKTKVMTMADAPKLRMVFENLIENAINYSEEGTKINVQLYKSKGFVILSIVDQGVGIAKEDLPKLFQKFSRIPNPLSVEVGGTGLGLYWANKIVSLHGGTIEVTSKLGKSTTFSVKLLGLK